MNPAIILFSGNKGGSGKSIGTMAYLDMLLQLEKNVCLVETDISGRDVGCAYEKTVPTEDIALDDNNGYVQFTNLLGKEEYENTSFVVNGAARLNEGAKEGIDTLLNALPELKRELIVFWMLNRQRPSLEMLRIFLDMIEENENSYMVKIYAVKNLYCGASEKFVLFDQSKTAKKLKERGSKVVEFPELADLVADEIVNTKQTIQVASEVQTIGNRGEIASWRKKVRKAFKEVMSEYSG